MPRSKRRSCFERVAILALLVVALGGDVRADDTDDVQAYRAALAEGATRFREHDYAGARAAFQRAYEIHADPVLVFNIASTHRREGDLQRAVDEYRRYLSLAPASEEGRRTLAEETIEVLEDSLERTARKETAAKHEASRREASRREANRREATERAATARRAAREQTERQRADIDLRERTDLSATTQTAKTSPGRRGRGVRIAGVTIGSTGAASLAYALFEFTRARDAQVRLGDATRWDDREAGLLEQGTVSSRRALLAGAVGAGLVGVGLTLYWVGNRGSSERSVRLGPTLGAHGAGAALLGSF